MRSEDIIIRLMIKKNNKLFERVANTSTMVLKVILLKSGEKP
jgi:hypothetical protein